MKKVKLKELIEVLKFIDLETLQDNSKEYIENIIEYINDNPSMNPDHFKFILNESVEGKIKLIESITNHTELGRCKESYYHFKSLDIYLTRKQYLKSDDSKYKDDSYISLKH